MLIVGCDYPARFHVQDMAFKHFLMSQPLQFGMVYIRFAGHWHDCVTWEAIVLCSFDSQNTFDTH